MKKIILNFENRINNFKELVQEALNRNLLNFLISQETFNDFEKIERINLYSKNPKIHAKNLVFSNKDKLKEYLSTKKFTNNIFGFFFELKNKQDEREIIEISKARYVDFVIVSAKDWKIVPFENLIAEMHSNDTELIASVKTIQEAEILLKTLEIGVDGILFKPNSIKEIIELKKLLHIGYNLKLTKARVKRIQNIPESERVCVDTTSLLNMGEGFLVGSTAAGFCLIHSETFETQFVPSRPFRVNAGDVSAYILIPSDDPQIIYRTKYLSELKGGDKVIAINTEGEVRIVSVGRVKIETRPMLRFELEAMKNNKKIQLSCVCQNAETVRLVEANGTAKSVVEIKVGDELLVHIGPFALHLGTIIRETIIEK
ncbi:MAG: 3-dehydroquinate synthase II [Promethearchaeota archaeon]|nr:MAG: 3-dehydroquinate synthase II [Candidatus Lokiarchaeota archaeon]